MYVTSNTFDFDELRKIVAIAVRNLNRVIDINYYPTPETKKSNMRHRPVGLGIQGLADVFAMLKYDWESPEAARLNQLIFEYMYFEAVSESARIAQVEGSYVTFPGSPASQGRLQPDMWNVTPLTEKEGTLDWATLRTQAKAGLRNSLLVAPMPTASTSQILGNNECFEPFTTNIYTRRTLAGEFTVLNKYLLSELRDAGLWSDSLKNEIIARNGSVQGIEAIPVDVQARYKTTWEIKQRTLIDMARDRGAFIDQSQSLNLFVADPTYSKLTSMHFYAWKAGLKTGCYYLRSKAPVVAQQFTVDPRLLSAISSGGKVADLSSDSEQDDSDEETPAATPVAPVAPLTKAEERRLLLERLSAEYEAEQAKGCTMCSS
jgi:ribonucleoside-diphosphate reductase alpha subunit